MSQAISENAEEKMKELDEIVPLQVKQDEVLRIESNEHSVV